MTERGPDIISDGMRHLATQIRSSSLEAAAAVAEMTCAIHGQEAIGKEVAQNIRKLSAAADAASVPETKS